MRATTRRSGLTLATSPPSTRCAWTRTPLTSWWAKTSWFLFAAAVRAMQRCRARGRAHTAAAADRDRWVEAFRRCGSNAPALVGAFATAGPDLAREPAAAWDAAHGRSGVVAPNSSPVRHGMAGDDDDDGDGGSPSLSMSRRRAAEAAGSAALAGWRARRHIVPAPEHLSAGPDGEPGLGGDGAVDRAIADSAAALYAPRSRRSAASDGVRGSRDVPLIHPLAPEPRFGEEHWSAYARPGAAASMASERGGGRGAAVDVTAGDASSSARQAAMREEREAAGARVRAWARAGAWTGKYEAAQWAGEETYSAATPVRHRQQAVDVGREASVPMHPRAQWTAGSEHETEGPASKEHCSQRSVSFEHEMEGPVSRQHDPQWATGSGREVKMEGSAPVHHGSQRSLSTEQGKEKAASRQRGSQRSAGSEREKEVTRPVNHGAERAVRVEHEEGAVSGAMYRRAEPAEGCGREQEGSMSGHSRTQQAVGSEHQVDAPAPTHDGSQQATDIGRPREDTVSGHSGSQQAAGSEPEKEAATPVHRRAQRAADIAVARADDAVTQYYLQAARERVASLRESSTGPDHEGRGQSASPAGDHGEASRPAASLLSTAANAPWGGQRGGDHGSPARWAVNGGGAGAADFEPAVVAPSSASSASTAMSPSRSHASARRRRHTPSASPPPSPFQRTAEQQGNGAADGTAVLGGASSGDEQGQLSRTLRRQIQDLEETTLHLTQGHAPSLPPSGDVGVAVSSDVTGVHTVVEGAPTPGAEGGGEATSGGGTPAPMPTTRPPVGPEASHSHAVPAASAGSSASPPRPEKKKAKAAAGGTGATRPTRPPARRRSGSTRARSSSASARHSGVEAGAAGGTAEHGGPEAESRPSQRRRASSLMRRAARKAVPREKEGTDGDGHGEAASDGERPRDHMRAAREAARRVKEHKSREQAERKQRSREQSEKEQRNRDRAEGAGEPRRPRSKGAVQGSKPARVPSSTAARKPTSRRPHHRSRSHSAGRGRSRSSSRSSDRSARGHKGRHRGQRKVAQSSWAVLSPRSKGGAASDGAHSRPGSRLSGAFSASASEPDSGSDGGDATLTEDEGTRVGQRRARTVSQHSDTTEGEEASEDESKDAAVSGRGEARDRPRRSRAATAVVRLRRSGRDASLRRRETHERGVRTRRRSRARSDSAETCSATDSTAAQQSRATEVHRAAAAKARAAAATHRRTAPKASQSTSHSVRVPTAPAAVATPRSATSKRPATGATAQRGSILKQGRTSGQRKGRRVGRKRTTRSSTPPPGRGLSSAPVCVGVSEEEELASAVLARNARRLARYRKYIEPGADWEERAAKAAAAASPDPGPATQQPLLNRSTGSDSLGARSPRRSPPRRSSPRRRETPPARPADVLLSPQRSVLAGMATGSGDSSALRAAPAHLRRALKKAPPLSPQRIAAQAALEAILGSSADAPEDAPRSPPARWTDRRAQVRDIQRRSPHDEQTRRLAVAWREAGPGLVPKAKRRKARPVAGKAQKEADAPKPRPLGMFAMASAKKSAARQVRRRAAALLFQLHRHAPLLRARNGRWYAQRLRARGARRPSSRHTAWTSWSARWQSCRAR